MIISKYEVRFFAVGQNSKGGDAIFIRLYDEKGTPIVIVIDGGYAEDGEKMLRYMVDECKLKTIDLIINTHPDKDHISGLIKIVESNEVVIKKIIMNVPWKDGKLYPEMFYDGRMTDNSLKKELYNAFGFCKKLEDIALKKNINLVHPALNTTPYFDCLKIIAPSDKYYRNKLLESDKTPIVESELNQKCYSKVLSFERYSPNMQIIWNDNIDTSSLNDTSIVCVLTLPNATFLFTGDVGKSGLNEALDYYESIGGAIDGITHMQVPHHGSKKNLNPTLIRRINANQYIISCPREGWTEGHPSKRLINKIKTIFPHSKIYLTQDSWLSYTYNLDVHGKPATQQQLFDTMDCW